MHGLVQYRPPHEVQPLRRVHFGCNAVDERNQFFVAYTSVPAAMPVLFHLVACALVGKHYMPRERLGVACTAEDELRMIGCRVNAVVVVERYIKIPHRTCVGFHIAAFLVHEARPYHIRVTANFIGEEVPCKRLVVNILPPCRIVGGALIHRVLHRLVIVLEVRPLCGHYLVVVRRVQCHRDSVGRVVRRGFLIGITVNLPHISAAQRRAGHVGRCHFVNLHATFLHFYLVAQLVATFVFAVQYDVHGTAERCVGHFQHVAHVERQYVPEQCLVAVVVHQHPVFRLGGRT